MADKFEQIRMCDLLKVEESEGSLVLILSGEKRLEIKLENGALVSAVS